MHRGRELLVFVACELGRKVYAAVDRNRAEYGPVGLSVDFVVCGKGAEVNLHLPLFRRHLRRYIGRRTALGAVEEDARHRSLNQFVPLAEVGCVDVRRGCSARAMEVPCYFYRIDRNNRQTEKLGRVARVADFEFVGKVVFAEQTLYILRHCRERIAALDFSLYNGGGNTDEGHGAVGRRVYFHFVDDKRLPFRAGPSQVRQPDFSRQGVRLASFQVGVEAPGNHRALMHHFQPQFPGAESAYAAVEKECRGHFLCPRGEIRAEVCVESRVVACEFHAAVRRAVEMPFGAYVSKVCSIIYGVLYIYQSLAGRIFSASGPAGAGVNGGRHGSELADAEEGADFEPFRSGLEVCRDGPVSGRELPGGLESDVSARAR